MDSTQTLFTAWAQVLPHRAWPTTRMWVPHTGAAQRVRQVLRMQGAGLLPEILVLQDVETLAAALHIAPRAEANPWPLRARALAALQQAHPGMDVPALLPLTEALMQSLNLLAAHDISVAALAASVPPELRDAWAFHGALLLELWAWAEPRQMALLPAARRRAMLQNVTSVLRDEPFAGTQFWLGDAPQEQVLGDLYSVLQAQGCTALPWPVPPSQPTCVVAETPWEEAQHIAAWVVRHLGANTAPVAVVAGGAMAGRVGALLQASYSLIPRSMGGMRWLATPHGQQLLQQAAVWPSTSLTLSMGYWLKPLLEETALPLALRTLLEELSAVPERWDGTAAAAWLGLALQALAPTDDAHEEDVAQDARVRFLPPHAVAYAPFQAILVAEMVEGVWPAQGHGGALAQGQRRALGLPDASAQAEHAHGLLQQMLCSGVPVTFTRSRQDDAGDVVQASRWWPEGEATPTPLTPLWPVVARPAAAMRLGQFTPAQPPAKASPSVLADLLICPYKAYAQRVLKVQKLPPLLPQPDPRETGTLVHAWLEAAVRNFPQAVRTQQPEVEAFLLREANRLMAQQNLWVQTLWQPKLKKLAPMVAAALCDGQRRTAEVALSAPVTAGWSVQARADVVTEGASGACIADYKTGKVPSAAQVKRGEAPQLAIEAWIMQQQGQAIQALAYWKVRGYGDQALQQVHIGGADMTDAVGESLSALHAQHYMPHARWPALPDAQGGGVLATGLCARCDLQGLCRRVAVALEGAAV